MDNEEKLIQYLDEVLQELLSTVTATDLTKEGSESEVLRKIESILSQFGKTIQEVLPAAVIQSYFGGVNLATAALVGAGAAVAPTLALTEAGLIAKPFQKAIHLEAVREIVDDSMLDIAKAIARTRESSAAAITKTVEAVRADMAKGLIKGDARRVTEARVMKTFLDDGLTAFKVTDKNGRTRKLPLHYYSMTVVRSKTRQATVQGSANRYRDAGHDLVKINGNGDSCAKCSQYRNMVVSLDGKTKGYPAVGQNGIQLPPFHPNCRCGTSVFMLSVATDDEKKQAKEQNRKYKPGKDQRTPAQRKSYEREQAARRKANEEMKQFMRWQTALGAEAPKTLGAFRRMKRQNTPKFQDLQSQYRSFAQTNRQ